MAERPAPSVLAEDLRALAEVVPFDGTTTKLLFDAADSLDAPDPGYERIAEAIRNACDVAAVDLTVTFDLDDRPTHSNPHYTLARMLDQAGLIDWSAFTEEDTDD